MPKYLTYSLVGLVCGISFSSIAEEGTPVTVVEESADIEARHYGLEKTLELNFSPEKREILRKALDEYSRTVDEHHAKIEARRRAMRESIKKRFFDADVDFNNQIDRQEATNKLPQIARHFSAVDLNKDELISLSELVSAQDRMTARRQAAKKAIEMRKFIGTNKQFKIDSTQASNEAPQSPF